MIGKHFTESSHKVELRINCVRINRARPVLLKIYLVADDDYAQCSNEKLKVNLTSGMNKTVNTFDTLEI